MTPEERVIRAGALALHGWIIGFIDWKEIEEMLRPLAALDQSLGAAVQPIIQQLLKEREDDE